jgi:hypothetical protein
LTRHQKKRYRREHDGKRIYMILFSEKSHQRRSERTGRWSWTFVSGVAPTMTMGHTVMKLMLLCCLTPTAVFSASTHRRLDHVFLNKCVCCTG